VRVSGSSKEKEVAVEVLINIIFNIHLKKAHENDLNKIV